MEKRRNNILHTADVHERTSSEMFHSIQWNANLWTQNILGVNHRSDTNIRVGDVEGEMCREGR